ncbi:pre-toxin TG domain-containing protein [Paenibacillus athensensis]|uniref:Tox-PL domain-containing protein n=1 Tax=Paenibacillus athensensis TaxID=1967502 RepID=A0A4Y8PUG0_9BACL|nr:pre-toxin TG domain-containing protein [Paenibacillus athensensis]MCD1261696.1 pre-toxin TG domain-containing protein [Paenibacillus athensensis]
MSISGLKVDVDVIRSLTQDASRQTGKLAEVRSGVGLLVYGLEGGVSARRGISSRINKAQRDVDSLQQRLTSLYACIREATDRYQQAEDGLAGRARDFMERRSLPSSYPDIPGLDWSKVPDNMKQQLLDSIANAEQQKYQIPGLDWDKVPANLRDQLRASIDQAAQQRAYLPAEEPQPQPVSLAERTPAEFKAMVGGYEREHAGSNDVYYIDEHGKRTLIDFDNLQALMAEFNRTGANYHPGDILMMMPVDYTKFFQYAVEQGYDPRTFLPLNPQDRDAMLGYVIGRKVFEEESRQKARAWESLVLDLTPIVGSIKAVIDLSTGKDSVTGHELDGWDYGIAGAGILAPVVAKPIAKGISKGVKAVFGTEEAVKDGARVAELGNGIGSAYDHVYTSIRPVEEVFPELKNINPHYVEDASPGINTNCTSCANATHSRLSGTDLEAIAQNMKGYGYHNDLLPSSPWGFEKPSSVSEVIEQVSKKSDGFTAPVVIHQGNILHVINVINKNGEVIFIDSQIGKIVELDPKLILELGKPN